MCGIIHQMHPPHARHANLPRKGSVSAARDKPFMTQLLDDLVRGKARQCAMPPPSSLGLGGVVMLGWQGATLMNIALPR